MKVFILDWRSRRNWQAICRRAEVELTKIWCNDEELETLNALNDGDVVVCHGVGEHDEVGLENIAKANRFYAILVSGRAGAPRTIGDFSYHRGAAVGEDDDAHFGRYLNRFCSDLLHKETPTFGLLEPAPCPEHLVAVYIYLLFLARRQGLASVGHELQPDFWSAAVSEWLEREGNNEAWLDVGLPATGAALGTNLDVAAAVDLLKGRLVTGG